MTSSFIFSSRDLSDTFKLAREWVGCVPPGALIGLTGEIGSGKTAFVKGLAEALNVKSGTRVTSPTFTVMHIYDGARPLYHFDVYRLEGEKDIAGLGMDDYLSAPGTYVAVEWAEKVRSHFPEDYTWIQIRILSEAVREITVTGHGKLAAAIELLAKKLNVNILSERRQQ